MLRKLSVFIATGTYSGLIPIMPGTMGTLCWGIPLAYALSKLPTPHWAVAFVVFTAFSMIISHEAVKSFKKKDPGAIVIDEVAGFALAFFLIPFTVVNCIIVFILFRFFDILKPPPIKFFERLPGGIGIVADDLIAGILANLVTHGILRYIL
ncbi:MAG: phosphatidylglycerophosphatase A [Deltaproteobacteria bacterium]|nr:phosphatidylglycerophosphatase A [Deltaproteobacteria bacterium]